MIIISGYNITDISLNVKRFEIENSNYYYINKTADNLDVAAYKYFLQFASDKRKIITSKYHVKGSHERIA